MIRTTTHRHSNDFVPQLQSNGSKHRETGQKEFTDLSYSRDAKITHSAQHNALSSQVCCAPVAYEVTRSLWPCVLMIRGQSALLSASNARNARRLLRYRHLRPPVNNCALRPEIQ